MNREIEFRAWLKKHLKVVDVKRIDFEAQEIVYEEIDFEYEDVIREKTALFKDISLSEYTGLKDKNRTKIFEGDILKNNDGIIYRVGWATTWYGFQLVSLNTKIKSHCRIQPSGSDENYNLPNCEVIGNIYENKKLLGGEEYE